MSKGNNEVITEYSGLRYSTKHTDWQYENEFRIIIDGHKNKPLSILEAIIEGIIFGINTSNEHKQDTINATQSFKTINLYQAVKSTSKFEIDIKKYSA